MLKIIKLSIMKEIWEFRNNNFKLILGILINIAIVIVFYYSMINQKDINIFGLNYATFIVIYSLLWLIMSSFSQVSNIIVNESKMGTIEQLIISPFGLMKILLVKILIRAMISISFITIVLIISNSITNNFNLFNIITFVLILMIGIFSLYGVGIIIASISLFSKEINFIGTIVKFAILYIILKFENNLVVPFSYAKTILTELIINNKSISEYSIVFIVLFITNSVIYLLGGMICFGFVERFALKKGNLGGY